MASVSTTGAKDIMITVECVLLDTDECVWLRFVAVPEALSFVVYKGMIYECTNARWVKNFIDGEECYSPRIGLTPMQPSVSSIPTGDWNDPR